MKKAILTPLLLLYCLVTFSQDTYVDLNNQTTQGTVENYRAWIRNPTEVKFKTTAGTEIVLTLQNCKSFTVDKDVYISYTGTRIINTDNAMNITGLVSDTMQKDTISAFLLQVYARSNYALYKLFDSKRTNFYLSDNDNVEELEYFETIDSKMVTPKEGYKAYLYQKFKDAGDANIVNKIRSLTYTETDLVKFLTDILNDKAHSSERSRNRYPAEIFIGVGGTANMSSLVDGNGKTTFKETAFEPSFEIGLRLYSQRNFGKFIFQPSINVMPLSNSFDNGKYKLKTTMFSANLGAGYAFIKTQAFSLYALVNGSLMIPFSEETTNATTSTPVTDKSTYLNDRVTIRPELGAIINRSFNVVVGGYLPLHLPFAASSIYRYEVSGVSFGVRYAFIQHAKK
jgi:hypothetical protein